MLFAYLSKNVASLKVCILIEEFELDCKYFNRDLCKKSSIPLGGTAPLIIDGADFVSGTENILVHLAEKWGSRNESIKWKYKIASWLLQFKSMFSVEEFCGTEEFIFKWSLALNYINEEICKNGFLVGAEFTVADISLWAELHTLKSSELELDLSQYVHIEKYYTMISRMDSIARANSIISNTTIDETVGVKPIFVTGWQKVGGLNAL